MKTCSECKENKPFDDFYQRSGKRSGEFHQRCIACTLKFQCERWKARKATAVELFGGKCCNCGYDKNLAALDFHHVDPETKEHNWNELSRKPWQEIIVELKKCILVCKNCHAEIHCPHLAKELIDVGCANRSLTQLRFKSVESSGVCPICNAEVYGTTFCTIECARKSQRKVVRPDKNTLKNEIAMMPFTKLAEKYGVSDNAVRKWAKGYGLIES